MTDMHITERAKGSGARVLLVSTNRERQPYPVVPNGLACIASALDRAGHRVRFLDLCFASDPVVAARRAATDFARSDSETMRSVIKRLLVAADP